MSPNSAIVAVVSQCDTVSSFIYMYADDTKLGRQVATAEDSKKLQADLDSIQQWSDKWQLKFNSTKCKVIHLGYENSKATYTMINDKVEVSLEHSKKKILVFGLMIN